jgi:hypothetical protein
MLIKKLKLKLIKKKVGPDLYEQVKLGVTLQQFSQIYLNMTVHATYKNNKNTDDIYLVMLDVVQLYLIKLSFVVIGLPKRVTKKIKANRTHVMVVLGK